MQERSLIDTLLYELDGQSTVIGDAATEQLEAVLGRIRSLTAADRANVVAELDYLQSRAEKDVLAAQRRHSKMLNRASEWKSRAAESSGTLAVDARERAEQAQADAAATAEELAEYRATVERLTDILALFARVAAQQP